MATPPKDPYGDEDMEDGAAADDEEDAEMVEATLVSQSLAQAAHKSKGKGRAIPRMDIPAPHSTGRQSAPRPGPSGAATSTVSHTHLYQNFWFSHSSSKPGIVSNSIPRPNIPSRAATSPVSLTYIWL